MADPVRVVLVDDQELIRAGISLLLSGDPDVAIEVVGEAPDGAAGVELIRRLHPDLVLMDIRMPGMNGSAAVRAIRADPDLRSIAVVMLTTFDDDDDVGEALRSGADGYLLKDSSPGQLRSAVLAAAGGDPVLAPAVARRMMTRTAAATDPVPDPRLTRLTERELAVLVEVSSGGNNETIARTLHLSPETVRTYVSRILTKLEASSRAQLVALAHRSGLHR
jgi:DNA-binding NarL/FixJ family response regulator